jgi:hypothetical protein
MPYFQILATICCSYLCQIFMPWWSMVICAGIISFFFNHSYGLSFWCGFVAIVILWMTYATLIDIENDSILSVKMAPIFRVSNVTILIILTWMLGGIIVGIGDLCGRIFRELFVSIKRSPYGKRNVLK